MSASTKTLSPIEKELQALLGLFQQPQAAADSFFDRLSQRVLSLSDQKYICTFFWKVGQEKRLCDIFLEHLENNHPIAWDFFIETLDRMGFEFNEDFALSSYQGALEQESLDSLCRVTHLDLWLPELKDRRKAIKQKTQARFEEEKQRLLNELALYRAQGLESKEQEALNALQILDPRDPSTQDKLQEFKLRKAMRLLEDRPHLTSALKLNQLSEEDALSDVSRSWLVSQIIDHLKAHNSPQEAYYDFAICFTQSELPEEALIILQELTNPPLPALWLKLELEMRTEQYFKALETLMHLEEATRTDPEAPMALQYEKAQILWHMGQKKKAIKLIEDILQVTPDYRSAQTLIRIWRSSHAG